MRELTQLIIDYFNDKNYDITDVIKATENLQMDVVSEFLSSIYDKNMYVIKRSGNLEEFSEDKILRSIKDAAKSKDQYLNTSDLNNIMEDVRKSMKAYQRKVFKTSEIKDMVKKALENEGFSKIYDSYVSYIHSIG